MSVKAKAKTKSRSQMTPFERWTLYLTATGVLVSLGLQMPGIYFDYFRNVRSLVVIPLDVELAYSSTGIDYLASMTFVNDGNQDVILRGFAMRLATNDLQSSTPDSTETMTLPWDVSAFILRAGDEATYEYRGDSEWRRGFLRCSREEPHLGEAMRVARLQLLFEASTLEHGASLRQYVDINVKPHGMGHMVGGSQSPSRPDFARLDREATDKIPMPPSNLSVTVTPPC